MCKIRNSSVSRRCTPTNLDLYQCALGSKVQQQSRGHCQSCRPQVNQRNQTRPRRVDLTWVGPHSKFLYPIAGDAQQPPNLAQRNANMYPYFQFVNDQIVARLQELLSNTDTSFINQDHGISSLSLGQQTCICLTWISVEMSSTITGAFSMALCCTSTHGGELFVQAVSY